MLGTVIRLFIPASVHLYTDKPVGDLLRTIGYKDAGALQVQMSRTTSEETRSRKSQIYGMHSKMDKMEPNVTTTVQHNIFIQKDICRGVDRPHNNPGLTSTSMRKQTLDNEDKSTVAMLVLTNRGTPLQQGSIGSAHEETEMETLDTDGRLGM